MILHQHVRDVFAFSATIAGWLQVGEHGSALGFQFFIVSDLFTGHAESALTVVDIDGGVYMPRWPCEHSIFIARPI